MDDLVLPDLNRERLAFLRDVAAGHVTRTHDGRDRLRANTRNTYVPRKAERDLAEGLIHLVGDTYYPTPLGEAVIAADDARKQGAIKIRTI